jgi:hypothetical protein
MRKLIKENKRDWPMSDNITPDQYYINQCLDKLDTKACEVESRWGVARLDRLVSFDMAQKWQRQMDRLNEAIENSDVATLPEIVNGTIRGYEVMEADAMAQGHKPHDAPLAWTVAMPGGKTLAIVRHEKDFALFKDNAREFGDVTCWTLDQIASIIENKYTLVNLKTEQEAVALGDDPFDFSKGDDIPEF